MNIEFTGLTYQQVNQSNASLLVFPLCVLLVYLVLAALYESWLLPLSVILIVPMCLLSAVGGIWLLNTVKGLYFGLSIAANWIPPPPISAPPSFIDLNIFTQSLLRNPPRRLTFSPNPAQKVERVLPLKA